MDKHILSGCKPKPLASYLKAIGILRLVSEQKDSQVKGWWQGETFVISTKLGRDEFESFFCEDYSPTPIVAPWNGGSGFYMGDDVRGLEAITSCQHRRFEDYRSVILQIQSWPEIPSFNTVQDVKQVLRTTLEGMRPGRRKDELEGLLQGIESSVLPLKHDSSQITLSEVETISRQRDNPDQAAWRDWWNMIKKARTQCNTIRRNENKKVILPRCRSRLPETSLKWLDAVYAIQSDGGASFNPVLGTGGNEGRFDFSNNFIKRVAELFIDGYLEKTANLFSSAVLNTVLPGLISASIGQYDPGRAGGYNQGTEVETKGFKINPWDFILAVEGALVLGGAVVRRNPTEDRSQYTTPFTVNFSSVGFSSSAYLEMGRKETWLPIWRNPASYPEVKYIFGEGRTSIGRHAARTGIEFSRAVGTLGVDRGIDAFERYAFLERRGQSYVALPAGRINVRYKPELELLNDLDAVLRPASLFMRLFKNLPATFQSARQRIDEAVFACTQKPDPHSFCEIVRAVGNLEKHIATRDRSKKPTLNTPLFGLSPLWIAQCDDGSVEGRIAGALASIRATGKVGPIRSNLAGIDPSNPRRWSVGRGECHWFGNSLHERLVGVLSRRLMDAERKSEERTPIEARLPISPHDVMPFLWGDFDEAKLEELLWGFALINWRGMGIKKLWKKWEMPIADFPLSRTWCVLKLLHSPLKIRKTPIKREQRIAHLLMAGRIKEACGVAIHRLRVSELRPFNVMYEEDLDSIRLLASLLIPVKDQWKMESLVLDKQTSTD